MLTKPLARIPRLCIVCRCSRRAVLAFQEPHDTALEQRTLNRLPSPCRIPGHDPLENVMVVTVMSTADQHELIERPSIEGKRVERPLERNCPDESDGRSIRNAAATQSSNGPTIRRPYRPTGRSWRTMSRKFAPAH